MNGTNFTENSYEQAVISLFEEMGYRYECGYDIERDLRNPLYDDILKLSLKHINPQLSLFSVSYVVKQLKDIDGSVLVQKNEKFI